MLCTASKRQFSKSRQFFPIFFRLWKFKAIDQVTFFSRKNKTRECVEKCSKIPGGHNCRARVIVFFTGFSFWILYFCRKTILIRKRIRFSGLYKSERGSIWSIIWFWYASESLFWSKQGQLDKRCICNLFAGNKGINFLALQSKWFLLNVKTCAEKHFTKSSEFAID